MKAGRKSVASWPRSGPKRIPAATIRAVWLDPAIPRHAGAEIVGLSPSNFWRRAKALGLVQRPRGKDRQIADREAFAEWWAGGVAARDIAAHFGVSACTVLRTAKGWGLPPRGKGFVTRSRAEFEADRLAARMTAQAEQDMRAWRARRMA